MRDVLSLARPRPSASTQALLEDGELAAVAAGMSKDPNGKVTVLLLPAGAGAPAYALKVPLTPDAGDAVEREELVLRALEGFDLGGLGETVPRVLGRRSHGGLPALLTTALPGRSLLAAYHDWRHTASAARVAGDFRMAAAWLAAFQRATAAGAGELLPGTRLFSALLDRFGEHPGLDAALELLASVNGRLGGLEAPQSAVHGDYWCGNLLATGERLSGVVDWEQGAVCGAPARDLARFAIAYSLYLDRHSLAGRVAGHRGLRAGPWGAGVEYAVCGRGWYPALVRDFVADGLERLTGDRRPWRQLLLAGVAEVAAAADHDDFARCAFELLVRLGGRDQAVLEG